MTQDSVSREVDFLKSREVQRHHIPYHLQDGNRPMPKEVFENVMNWEVFREPLKQAVHAYPFEAASDPLVLYVDSARRQTAWWVANSIHQALRDLCKWDAAAHALDWWYRPVGLAEDRALFAIRPLGLYELSVDDAFP